MLGDEDFSLLIINGYTTPGPGSPIYFLTNFSDGPRVQ
jgi:hypothetical protein